MERDTKPNLIHIEKEPIEMELLDAEPLLLPHLTDTRNIRFGNTGFFLQFVINSDPTMESIFDFTPESSFRFYPERAAKNASMLSVALFEVHKFLNDDWTLKHWRISVNKIGETSALTNEHLVLGLKKLFTEHGHEELVRASKQLNEVTIDLKSFRDLDKSDSLLVYLGRIKDRAKNLIVRKPNLIV